MDDLISRDEAIRALMNSELGSWNNDDYERGTRAQHLDDVAAIKSVPSAQPEPRWIDVKERLPKPNELEDGVQTNLKTWKYYLIQNEFTDMTVATYRKNDSGYTWWEPMYAYNPGKVIAWMPLPKPYERSEE